MDACEMQGCDQTARFGLQSSILPIRCGRHRGEGMVEVRRDKKWPITCRNVVGGDSRADANIM